jgi:hypothetical protein
MTPRLAATGSDSVLLGRQWDLHAVSCCVQEVLPRDALFFRHAVDSVIESLYELFLELSCLPVHVCLLYAGVGHIIFLLKGNR